MAAPCALRVAQRPFEQTGHELTTRPVHSLLNRITSPMLLIALGFLVGGFVAINKFAPEPLQVGEHVVTQKSLYTVLFVIGMYACFTLPCAGSRRGLERTSDAAPCARFEAHCPCPYPCPSILRHPPSLVVFAFRTPILARRKQRSAHPWTCSIHRAARFERVHWCRGESLVFAYEKLAGCSHLFRSTRSTGTERLRIA